MTTSRIVRGTKIRIFLCFCAAVVILGLLACYNNTLSQLDESQKAVTLCHQQQENLSNQLQVITEYKLRLERDLKAEKTYHVRSNETHNQLLKDEKMKNEKNLMEGKLRFNSLQQRYNLLQTEYDDFKEKTTKNIQDHLDEITELRSKLKRVEEDFAVVNKSKENLKTEYLNIQIRNDEQKKQLDMLKTGSVEYENKTNYLKKQNIELMREIDELKDRCVGNNDAVQAPVMFGKSFNNADQESNVKENVQGEDQNVLVMPMPNDKIDNVKSSSTASSVKQSSQGQLNGARPLAVPTMNQKDAKDNDANVLANPNEDKVPEGVLPVPKKLPEENELSNDIVDNRYQNKIQEAKQKKHEEMEKENGANEVFELHNVGDEGLGFGDSIKLPPRQSNNIQHIDNLGIKKDAIDRNEVVGGDYKGQNDQLEENAAMDEGEDGKFRDNHDHNL